MVQCPNRTKEKEKCQIGQNKKELHEKQLYLVSQMARPSQGICAGQSWFYVRALELRKFLRQHVQTQDLDNYRQAQYTPLLVRWSPPKKIPQHTEIIKGECTMPQTESDQRLDQGTTRNGGYRPGQHPGLHSMSILVYSDSDIMYHFIYRDFQGRATPGEAKGFFSRVFVILLVVPLRKHRKHRWF